MSNESNIPKLVGLLGEDPIKRPSLTDEIFAEALADLQKQRREQALTEAKETIKQAVELREKMHKLEQEFNKSLKKFNEELGKLLSKLRTSVEKPVVEAAPVAEAAPSEQA